MDQICRYGWMSIQCDNHGSHECRFFPGFIDKVVDFLDILKARQNPYAYPSSGRKLNIFSPSKQLEIRISVTLSNRFLIRTEIHGVLPFFLRQVRHCCFIIGPTGAGKTEIWRSLEMSLIAIGEDCRWEQVNPKAITADELYGIFQKAGFAGFGCSQVDSWVLCLLVRSWKPK